MFSFQKVKGKRLSAYQQAFSSVLKNAVNPYELDLIHTHDLLVVGALAKKLFKNLPVVATYHGTDIKQFENCPY